MQFAPGLIKFDGRRRDSTMTTGKAGSIARLQLLPRLAFFHPVEFVDRIRTKLEARDDRSTPPATVEGTYSEQLVRRMAQVLGPELETAYADAGLSEIEAAIAQAQQALAPNAAFGTFHDADFVLARFCYAVCRAQRPKVVLETGVAFGVTTGFILQALAQNGCGELWSVDLPPLGKNADAQVGFLVPADLKSRWRLVRGSCRRMLPRVIDELETIDIFLHDSLHTHKHMKWEFETAWPHLRSGGVLISDDVTNNRAFEEVTLRWSPRAAGVARKEKTRGCFAAVVKA
jgi:predicted O-methyltransferase YrrM